MYIFTFLGNHWGHSLVIFMLAAKDFIFYYNFSIPLFASNKLK